MPLPAYVGDMAHTGRDDQRAQDTASTSTAGWNWGAGIAVGLGIGVALGIALDNLAIGIALGVAFFPVFAMMRVGAAADDETQAPGDEASRDEKPDGL